MRINSSISNPKLQFDYISGMVGGLNDFQDETLIKDSELTKAKNILLDVDGISPRPGTINYGSVSGSRVLGSFPFYKSDGTRELLRFCTGATNKLQKYVSDVPTDIGSNTFDPSARMNFVQARDKVFGFNGINSLFYYDGAITVYTALTTPVGLTVAPQGTAGTTPYSYRINAFNNAGETLACVAVATATGNLTLNSTNYNKIDWTAVSGAVGYNIYGRKSTGLGETFMATVYTNTYNDQGQDTPALSILPPEANTSAGVKSTMAIFAISRIFAAGDPAYPSRLYFSGTGDQITNFSASALGGGYVDVFRNDGSKIRAIRPFQGGVIIWKDNAIYKFTFTSSGEQQLEEITRSFGGISFRSCVAVENDLIFAALKDGRLAFYSLGNQENYSASILRTNELSIKCAISLADVNINYLEHAAAFYYRNIYGCAIPKSGSTTNDRVWCLDTRFGAWTYWEGIPANHFTVYQGSSGSQDLYYGSETSGYMVKMFQDIRLDNGSAISGEFATKSFNQKLFNVYKKYFYPDLQFKDVTRSGGISGSIYIDGTILSSSFSVTGNNTGGTGLGAYMLGAFMLGEGAGSTSSSQEASDIPVHLLTINHGRSIKFNFRFNSTTDIRFKFLSLSLGYEVKQKRHLPQTTHSYVS